MKTEPTRRSPGAKAVRRHVASSMTILAQPGPDHAGDNPYLHLLYGAMQRCDPALAIETFTPRRMLKAHGGSMVWHMHWPQSIADGKGRVRPLVDVLAVLVSLRVARARGWCIVWTVHNISAHEGRRIWLENILMRHIVRYLDGIIALSPEGATTALERYPALRKRAVAVIPHGHYIDEYPNTLSEDESRRVLGVAGAQGRTVLLLGNIRPYKNVLRLIDAFSRIQDRQARLIIAGDPLSADLGDAIRTAAVADTRIQVHLRRIPRDEVQVFMNAADLIVLPFTSVLNSGSALLALSFGKPVLVPRKGAMPELRDVAGESAVLLYSGDLQTKHVSDALMKVRQSRMESHSILERVQSRLSWNSIGARTLEYFEDLCHANAAVSHGTD